MSLDRAALWSGVPGLLSAFGLGSASPRLASLAVAGAILAVVAALPLAGPWQSSARVLGGALAALLIRLLGTGVLLFAAIQCGLAARSAAVTLVVVVLAGLVIETLVRCRRPVGEEPARA